MMVSLIITELRKGQLKDKSLIIKIEFKINFNLKVVYNNSSQNFIFYKLVFPGIILHQKIDLSERIIISTNITSNWVYEGKGDRSLIFICIVSIISKSMI